MIKKNVIHSASREVQSCHKETYAIMTPVRFRSMRMPRLRFSMRGMFIAITIFCVLLALGVQFGPHVYWLTFDASRPDIKPIPSKPLIALPLDEELVICHVGPVSFELPKLMSSTFKVHRGSTVVFLLFSDNQRTLILELPQKQIDWNQYLLADVPGETKLSFPRYLKEMADAQSSDFSFTMSHREFQYHAKLMESRQSLDRDSIEYLWRPDLEGVLSICPLDSFFQWSTVDRKWQGTIRFGGKSVIDADWIRHPCESFAINGAPAVFQNCTNAEIKAMVRFSDRDASTHMQAPTK